MQQPFTVIPKSLKSIIVPTALSVSALALLIFIWLWRFRCVEKMKPKLSLLLLFGVIVHDCSLVTVIITAVYYDEADGDTERAIVHAALIVCMHYFLIGFAGHLDYEGSAVVVKPRQMVFRSWYMMGSSLLLPLVALACAICISMRPSLTPQVTLAFLISTCCFDLWHTSMILFALGKVTHLSFWWFLGGFRMALKQLWAQDKKTQCHGKAFLLFLRTLIPLLAKVSLTISFGIQGGQWILQSVACVSMLSPLMLAAPYDLLPSPRRCSLASSTHTQAFDQPGVSHDGGSHIGLVDPAVSTWGETTAEMIDKDCLMMIQASPKADGKLEEAHLQCPWDGYQRLEQDAKAEAQRSTAPESMHFSDTNDLMRRASFQL